MSNYRKVFASLIVGVGTIAGVSSAQADPANGVCNDLDPSSGLFSTCIQAHSAANRIDHLGDVGANQKAIDKAVAALEAAQATYVELDVNGTGIVPGFEAPGPRIFAVAYINIDGGGATPKRTDPRTF